jgi:hypothetical protein
MRLRLLIAALLLTLLLTPLVAMPAAAWCGPGVTYTVQPGDTLFRIALNYGTTMQAIAQANGIWDYSRIYWGTTLTIPCAGGYTPPPPVYNPPPVYYPPAPPVYYPPQPPVYYPPQYPQYPPYHPPYQDNKPPVYGTCYNLHGTSPLGGLAHAANTFYWDPVYGVTAYRVNVYSVDINPGGLVGTWTVSAPTTNVLGDLGSVYAGFSFEWEVQGLYNGNVVCSSPRYRMLRATS